MASLLRIAWLLLCPNSPTSDQTVYHQAAVAMVEGRGFVDEGGAPHGWWPVGYSAALVPFYAALGSSPRSGHIANLLFALALVVGVHRLALLLRDHRVAAWAAMLAAVNPTHVMMTTVLALENLYTPGIVWALCLLVRRTATGPAWTTAASFGMALGAAAYVRAPALLLALLVPLWWRANGATWRRTLVASVVTGTAAIVILLPWGFRTHRAFGTFQMVSMNGQSNLWMGNHPGSDGGYQELPPDVGALSIPAREEELGRRAKEFILANPVQYASLCARRVVNTIRSDTISVTWNENGLRERGLLAAATPLKAIATAVFWLTLLCTAFHLWRQRRRWAELERLLVPTLVLLALPFVAIVGGNRYHLPLAPMLWIVVAALAVSATSGPRPDTKR